MNIMYCTEACLNLNFEALHKLMFNETVCLEVFAALSNWLNASTSRGHFISWTSLAALMWHVLSCCVKPLSFQYCSFLSISPWPAKIPCASPRNKNATEGSNGLITYKTLFMGLFT